MKKRMKKKMLAIMLSFLMLLTVAMPSGLNPKAELVDVNESLTVEMSEGELSPGREVSLTLTVTNNRDVDVEITNFSSTLGGESFGTLTSGGVGETISANGSVTFTLEGTVPTDALNNDTMYISISAEDVEGNSYLATTFRFVVNANEEPDDHLPIVHQVTSNKMLEAGQPVELQWTLYNPSNKKREFIGISVGGAITDAVISEVSGKNIDGLIALHSGESMTLLISGIVSETATDEDMITLVFGSNATAVSIYSINAKFYTAYEATATKQNKLVAGKIATFDLEMTAKRDFTLNFFGCQYFPYWTTGDRDTCSDLECTVNAPSRYAFSAGETKHFEISVTVPSDWSETGWLNFYVEGIDSLGEYVLYTWDEFYEEVEVTETVETAKDTPKVTLPGNESETLVSAVFSDEELENATAVEAKLIAEKVEEENINADILSKIKAVAKNKKIAVILDLTVEKIIDGISKGTVSKLNNKITICVDIPEEYLANGRTFSVLREHNGVVTELKDLDTNPNTITFETDEFSLYSIVYSNASELEGQPDPTEEQEKQPTPSEDQKPTDTEVTGDGQSAETDVETPKPESKVNADAVKTGDPVNLGIVLLVFMLTGTGIVWFIKRKREC